MGTVIPQSDIGGRRCLERRSRAELLRFCGAPLLGLLTSHTRAFCMSYVYVATYDTKWLASSLVMVGQLQ